MEDEERRRWLLSIWGEARASWAIILGLLAASSFLSGLSYFHGFLGRLGFGSLVFSLPPQAYFAVGGIADLTVLLTSAVVAMIVAVIVVFVRRPQSAARSSRSRRSWSWITNVHPLVVIAAGVIEIAFAFVWTWAWLTPTGGVLPFPLAPWVRLLLLLLAVLVLIAAFIVTVMNFRGGPVVLLGITFLLAGSPLVAGQVGEYRANAIFDDLGGQPRALVWESANTTIPVGYVIVHQEGSLLYAVVQPRHDPGQAPVFHSTVIDITRAYRVDFIPPHVNETLTYNGTR